jgi:hypothetical protein
MGTRTGKASEGCAPVPTEKDEVALIVKCNHLPPPVQPSPPLTRLSKAPTPRGTPAQVPVCIHVHVCMCVRLCAGCLYVSMCVDWVSKCSVRELGLLREERGQLAANGVAQPRGEVVQYHFRGMARAATVVLCRPHRPTATAPSECEVTHTHMRAHTDGPRCAGCCGCW